MEDAERLYRVVLGCKEGFGMKVVPVCFGEYVRCRDCDGRRNGAVYVSQPCIARDRCKLFPEYLKLKRTTRDRLLVRRRVEIDERGNVVRPRPHGLHRLAERRPFLDELDKMLRDGAVESSRRCAVKRVSGMSASKLLEVFKSEVERLLKVRTISKDVIEASDGDLFWWGRGYGRMWLSVALHDVRASVRDVCRVDCKPMLRAVDVNVMARGFAGWFSKSQLASLDVVRRKNGFVMFRNVKRRGVGTIADRLASALDAGVLW